MRNTRCQALQARAELTLKAMITASGNQVQKTHDLIGLWDIVMFAECSRMSVRRNDEALRELSKYAGNYRYEPPREDEMNETLAVAEPVIEAVNRYANAEIGRIAQRGRRRRRIMHEMRCASERTLEALEELIERRTALSRMIGTLKARCGAKADTNA